MIMWLSKNDMVKCCLTVEVLISASGFIVFTRV